MSEQFEWTRVMHETKRRHLTVLRSELVAPRMQRITLGGEELHGFTSLGPADHVKVFFPDPVVGKILVPVVVDGKTQQPEGPGEVIVRDYTPYAFRKEGAHGPELDLDFVLHGDESSGDTVQGDASHGGPAAAWAAAAQHGDALIIAGPRGSRVPPVDMKRAILVADESALPSVTRWLQLLGSAEVTGLFSVADPGTESYLAEYAAPERDFRWFSGEDRDTRMQETLAGLSITDDTILFLAGEAGSLVPMRRYLRRELGLPKEQVDVHGYWKKGVVYLDHHAPIDPSDPE